MNDKEWSRWEVNGLVTVRLIGKWGVEVAYLYFDNGISINRLKSTGGIFFHGNSGESIRCNSFKRVNKQIFEIQTNNMELK